MDINGVSSMKPLQLYKNNSSKAAKETPTTVAANDSLEISTLGKKLSAYSIDDNFNASADKIATVKNSVENGTYNIDSKLVAQKMYDQMKGKGV